MKVDLSSESIADFVNEYQQYRSEQGARGLDIMTFCNGELEVDEYLSENMHLVWYGQFYQRFPAYWQLEPEIPPIYIAQASLQWKEKAKVRYVCECCGHTWTSMNGYIYFWAARGFQVYFHLPGATCSLCHTPSQPALWYPDEAIRVIDNLFAFLSGGVECRQKMEDSVTYRRGVGSKPPGRRSQRCSTPGLSGSPTDYASSICSEEMSAQDLMMSSRRKLSIASVDSGLSHSEMSPLAMS